MWKGNTGLTFGCPGQAASLHLILCCILASCHFSLAKLIRKAIEDEGIIS